MVRLVVLAVILEFSDPLGAQGQGFPLLRVWPDTTPPCNGTLQACVNAASTDDTIEIVTNGPIDESIALSKSVALQASPGFQPVFSAGRDIVASSPSSDRFFLIEGMTLAGGAIIVQNVVAGALTAWVRNNQCNRILVVANTNGPLGFRISGNIVTPVFSQIEAILVNGVWTFGEGEITGNTIAMFPSSNAIGISVEAQLGSMNVDVVANRVTGVGYASGIRVAQMGLTPLQARVVNNLVTGASADGYGIEAFGHSDADHVTDVSIVNNTVTENTFGIIVNGLDAVVANNVVTGSTESGFDIIPTFESTLVDRNNLAFDNGNDFVGGYPHPNAVFADPLYADTQEFRPTSHSPVVDAGDDTLVPPVFTTDLDGNPRQNGTVDIGAYEVPEPSLALGASAALLALAARGLSRRWTSGARWARWLPQAGGSCQKRRHACPTYSATSRL